MKLAGLGKSFGDLRVLDRLSAELPERGFVGVSGASGSGKTTLLRILAGLEQPDAGAIEGMPDRVSMLFEDDRLFPWMDVLSNVTLVGCSGKEAAVLLDELGLVEKTHARIAGLSGGQRRRVALARTLAFPAPLYLFDEPTARLDAESAALVRRAIWRHCNDALALIASHDQPLLAHCTHLLTIDRPLRPA